MRYAALSLLVGGLSLVAPAGMTFCCIAKAVAEVKVDADYPGGNIVVDRFEGDEVYLRQDLRDTNGSWFYWNFRVRGASGRTLTFHFMKGNVIGARGPAVSLDEGCTWSWLGTDTVKGASFRYAVGQDAKSVRFAFSLPYQETDLNRFLTQYKGNKQLAVHELCKTRKGRSVERIHIGRLDGQPTHRVLITCRHHACESTASYVVEGMKAALLAETEDGKWLRENAEVLVIPFMDKDGVEDGDQGKNRRPRDHCRDYAGKSLYPSVAALRTLVAEWSAGRLHIALDLHCPYIRDGAIYLVGSPDKTTWQAQNQFSRILESVGDKGLPYNASDNLPWGQGWNKTSSYKAGKPFFLWANELEDIKLSSAIEIPYANAGKATITPDTARAFGVDLVEAMLQYLEQL